MQSFLSRFRRWFTVRSGEQKKSDARRQHEERRQLIASLSAYIERDPGAGEIRDTDALPAPKEQLLEALCLEIAFSEEEAEAGLLMALAVMLAEFQQGVGNTPISPIGAQGHRFAELEARVDAETQMINSRLVAADTLRRAMPLEKKRILRG